jgi:polysaccharide chain length determinant protein (PEP-CTERM system associated)
MQFLERGLVDNSMETVVDGTRRVMKVVSRRRWLALGAGAVAALLSAIGISLIPDRYEAVARVYVDTQTVLKPLMTGLTYQPDIDQQVIMLAQTLVSRANVEKLIQAPELQVQTSDVKAREALIARLTEKIRVMPTASANLYEIKYRGPTPLQAKLMVQATVNLFGNAGAGSKKRDSQDAARFIEQQIHGYEVKLTEAENRLKDFKVRNFGVSGVSNQDYFLRISTLGEEVSKLRVELHAAEQVREAYRRELTSEDPQLPANLAARGGDPTAEVEVRLEQQRVQLDDLLRRYTEAHPDVVSARRVIAQLEAQLRERKEAEARAGGKVRRAATSPVYQKLRVSLAESEVQVASLRSQLAAQQGRLDQARSLAGRVPQVEAELAQLNRDYDVVRKNYELMVARRESALLGERLDASAQLAEFRVIEPPLAPPSPLFPGRQHLALLAVLLTLATGVGAAVMADRAWPTFDDTASLRAFTGRQVLGAVSACAPPGQDTGQARSVRFACALGALMTLQAIWVAWIVTRSPL